MEASIDEQATIYYDGTEFLVYNKSDALSLRRHRILGQFIGCCPKYPNQIVTSSYPYLLNHYAIPLILEKRLAKFISLKEKLNDEGTVAMNQLKLEQRLMDIRKKEEEEFMLKRFSELEKRGLELLPSRIGKFDPNKLKLTVPNEAEGQVFDLSPMSHDDVEKALKFRQGFNENLAFVFKDLYSRGFYSSSGMKFGSDFLIYLGDPIRYHAQYAVRLVQNRDKFVDLTRVDYKELNALNRLCHAANKTMLLVVVHDHAASGCKEAHYWTLSSRECIETDSDCSIFKPIDWSKQSSITRKDCC